MSLLSVSGISKKKEKDYVLYDISFEQQKQQRVAIAGETGSGKSTILKIIAGLVQPDAGEVLFEDKRVAGPEEKLLPGHPQIKYLSQHFELPNNYRAEEVLEMAKKMSDEESGTICEVCRINHLASRRTDQLSGGEKQRIALARLLISSPKLLLLDEPFSNLDIVHKNILKSVISDISERLKITCIIVSHDPPDILAWADEILVIKNGKILQNGTPQQVYKQPSNVYVASLFGSCNLITAAQAPAFSAWPGINMNGKDVLIRPENIKIVPEQSQALRGIVTKVTFGGSFYAVEILLPPNIITVKTTDANIEKGDTVYISISADDVWYV